MTQTGQYITSLTPVMLYAWPMIKPFGNSASSLPGSAYQHSIKQFTSV